MYVYPLGHRMALGWTQLIAEMSTNSMSWGVKVDGAQG
jgi:hypothetical protein